jgi:cytochrome c oxidase cbb3-type subunit III
MISQVHKTIPAILFRLALVTSFAVQVAAQAQEKAASVIPRSFSSEGARLFSSRCASCHGLDGHGGERAPDIADKQELKKTTDEKLKKIIREGVPGSGMPSFRSLGDVKIQALLRHLRGLQGQDSKSLLPGSPLTGKVLFFGKAACSECHVVNGAGGFMGSDLSAYGRGKSATEIRGIITNPNKYLEDRGRVVLVTTLEGKTFTGVERNEDNFTLQLQTRDGAFLFFQKSGVREIKHQREALMPSDYASRLSRQELDDIVSYLMNLDRSAPFPSRLENGKVMDKGR